MAGITTYLSILTLNVKGFNSSIKRHHLANQIKKADKRHPLQTENKHWLRVKG
jgi:hypothetical protein